MDQKKYISCWPLVLLLALAPVAGTAEEPTDGEGRLAAEHVKKNRDNYAAQDKLLS